MRITLTSGESSVDLRTDPGECVSLRAAEGAALRLLRALPTAATTSGSDRLFGFSLSSETERAPEHEQLPYFEEDE